MHCQWLYHNAKIHLRKLVGKTASEHKTVILEVRQMMLVNPEELLPQHCVLLERDFQALGEGSTVDRQIWLAQMKSALGAAEEILGGKRKEEFSVQQGSGLSGRRPVAVPIWPREPGSELWQRLIHIWTDSTLVRV